MHDLNHLKKHIFHKITNLLYFKELEAICNLMIKKEDTEGPQGFVAYGKAYIYFLNFNYSQSFFTLTALISQMNYFLLIY